MDKLKEQLEWEVALKKALLEKQEEWCKEKIEMREENNELAARSHGRGHTITEQRGEIRDLKKEIIRLKSLNRRAAEEIRDLDDHIIELVEHFDGADRVIGYDTSPLAPEGMSSINLLNRLEGRTSGGYVENYDDLHLEMKTLDGYAQIEHPDFYQKQEHSPECKWHKDWHACDCGEFDGEER